MFNRFYAGYLVINGSRKTGFIASEIVAVLVKPLASVTWKETVGLNTVLLLTALPIALMILIVFPR